MLASYHTHSRWSDGKQSLDEMLAAAASSGIAELGISDHWALHPDGVVMKWAMPSDRLESYVQDVLELRARSEKIEGPVVRLGLEVDWYPSPRDHGDVQRGILDAFPFDYLIGSVHEVDGFMIDGSPHAWRDLSQEQIDHVHRRYWQNMKSLASSGMFDIIAHIDLAKKFAFHAKCDLRSLIAEALDAIADASNKPVVELNTAGWHKPCDDGYPSVEILRECLSRSIDVTISADAHQPEHLLRDFDRAASRLNEVGYRRVARFAGRDRWFEPLENAVPGFVRATGG